ncbi:DUF5615 family PIN-like protein [Oscillatoria sp. HE19RPO]|uniref:DUF5615 family PIN-like protein n=1 Tax=Oscillatoria sp. HE19RPO TaxID=2954806 RepID=UPI0020C20856|nr:DUF5615 family PIN-like protein [Oscillatoria sp. HE19RPO]
MKFLADMGISPRTVAWLRSQGYDAIHLVEQGLEQIPDEAILVKAETEERIILTVELDFGFLLATTKSSLPSVILFRLGNASRETLEKRLADVLAECETELSTGAIISVSDEYLRVRRLPI